MVFIVTVAVLKATIATVEAKYSTRFCLISVAALKATMAAV